MPLFYLVLSVVRLNVTLVEWGAEAFLRFGGGGSPLRFLTGQVAQVSCAPQVRRSSDRQGKILEIFVRLSLVSTNYRRTSGIKFGVCMAI